MTKQQYFKRGVNTTKIKLPPVSSDGKRYSKWRLCSICKEKQYMQLRLIEHHENYHEEFLGWTCKNNHVSAPFHKDKSDLEF